jgi:hypothetical protein
MYFLLIPVAAGLVVFIVLAPILGFVKQDSSSSSFTLVFFIAGVSLSLVRLVSYWIWTSQARTGHLDASLFPFGLLLLPEAALGPEAAVLPQGGKWTLAQGILFSGMLVIGSFLWAAILGWSMRARKVS